MSTKYKEVEGPPKVKMANIHLRSKTTVTGKDLMKTF